MVKRTAVALVAAAAVALHVGAQAREVKRQTLRVGSIAPEGTPWADLVNRIKEGFEAGTGGRYKIRQFLGGMLGDEPAMVEQCREGKIQVFGGSAAVLANVAPEMGVFELPFLFNDYDEVDYVLDEVVVGDVEKILRDRGLVFLMWAENGFMSFATRYGAVRKPEDLKGRRMQAQSEAYKEMYKALGATPMIVGENDVLTMLQTGTLDGFDNTPIFSYVTSWYSAIKYYSLSRHLYQPAAVVMNRQWFESLPAADQRLFLSFRGIETVRSRREVRKLSAELLESIKKAGIKVYALTDEERGAFRTQLQPLYERFDKISPTAKQLDQKIQKALAEYRK
jgi:TRAP-type C4-dicarboxylate transport system substrate-binding protein